MIHVGFIWGDMVMEVCTVRIVRAGRMFWSRIDLKHVVMRYGMRCAVAVAGLLLSSTPSNEEDEEPGEEDKPYDTPDHPSDNGASI